MCAKYVIWALESSQLGKEDRQTWVRFPVAWEDTSFPGPEGRSRDLCMYFLIRINYICSFLPFISSWWSLISVKDYAQKGGHFICLKLCPPFKNFQLLISLISAPNSLMDGSSHPIDCLAAAFVAELKRWKGMELDWALAGTEVFITTCGWWEEKPSSNHRLFFSLIFNREEFLITDS